LKSADKTNLQNFLRTFAGIIPRVVTGARKGNACGKFWDSLAYSKLLTFGRQFKNTSNYIAKNTLETFGIIPNSPELVIYGLVIAHLPLMILSIQRFNK